MFQKVDKITLLQNKQNDAVNIIRKTLTDLQDVNDQIGDEIDKKYVAVKSLTSDMDTLATMKSDNEKLMKNFGKLLEV